MASTITPLPDPPSRSAPATFAERADAFLGAFPQFVTEANALAESSGADASTASSGAATATAKASEAAASAVSAAAATSAQKFVAGTTYTQGTGVWSPTTYQTYRCKTTGTYSVDPCSDPANWQRLSCQPITNIVTSATSIYLTNTPTMLKMTPTASGCSVILPDATLCDVSGLNYIITNSTDHHIKIYDFNSKLLGVLWGNTTANAGLASNASSSGAWVISGLSDNGITAELSGLYGYFVVYDSINLGGGRELLIGVDTYTNYVSCFVYNSVTNTTGNITTIKASYAVPKSILVSTDKVLVVMVTSPSALSAACLTISGTTVSVGSTATATISGTFSSHTDLVACNGSFIWSYGLSGVVGQMRAFTVSGTTVTIGSATNLDGYTSVLQVSGDKVLTATGGVGALYTKPYTISGTTITPGTGTSIAYSGSSVVAFLPLPSGKWGIIYYDTGTNVVCGGIITLTGTTTTISTVTLVTGTYTINDVILCNGKLVVATDTKVNILTDSSGTAVAGTAVSQILNAFLAAKDNYAYAVNQTAYVTTLLRIDCSGTTPTIVTLENLQSLYYGSLYTFLKSTQYGAKLLRPLSAIYSDEYVKGLFTDNKYDIALTGLKKGQLYSESMPPQLKFRANVAYRGKTDCERWMPVSYGTQTLYKMEYIP